MLMGIEFILYEFLFQTKIEIKTKKKLNGFYDDIAQELGPASKSGISISSSVGIFLLIDIIVL